jgi:hypothetical protein
MKSKSRQLLPDIGANANAHQPDPPIPEVVVATDIEPTLTCLLLHCAQPFLDFLWPTLGARLTLLSIVNQTGLTASIFRSCESDATKKNKRRRRQTAMFNDKDPATRNTVVVSNNGQGPQ